MKIAVSSQNEHSVTGHLGHCQKFWVYEVADKAIQGRQFLRLTKEQSFHESSPKDPHLLDDVQVLISGGMGQGLARRLAAKGIEPLITRETDPDIAVAAYLNGTLATLTPEEHHQAEHGEGEGHSHDPDHHHDH